MNAELMDLETQGAGGRLLAIRKVRDWLYIGEAALTVAFSVVLMFLGGQMQLVPLLIPISSFIYFVLAMGVILVGEAFVFRYLEIRFAKNDTARFYMVSKAQKRSTVVFIVALLFLIISLVPTVTNGMEDWMGHEGSTSGSVYFYNKDVTGTVTVDSITVESAGTTEVYIVTETIYNLYMGDMDSLKDYKINAEYLVDGTLEMDIPFMERTILYLVVNGDSVDYQVKATFTSDVSLFMPIVASGYTLITLGWTAFLIPMRMRYAKAAIYH